MRELKNTQKISALIGLITGFGNGLFGSGGGTLAVPCMEKFLNVKAQKAHATAVAIILPLSLVSGAVYFFGMDIPFRDAMLAGIGGLFGGIAGSKILGKIKSRYLHLIFGLVMVMSGIMSVFRHSA